MYRAGRHGSRTHRRHPYPGGSVRRSAIAAICLSVALSACATSGGTGNSAVSSASQSGESRSNAPRITAQEIADANLPTAYDLVERLRRPWLRRVGMGGDVVVYMDERKLEGGAAALRNMPATTVAELQYVANEEAVRRWGGDIKGAVIVVVVRR